jgi:endonuclease G
MFNSIVYRTTVLTLVFLSVSISSSCKQKEPKPEITLQISLSESAVIPNEGLVQWLRIETNSDEVWTVTVGQVGDWVSVTPTTGTSTRSVSVTARQNSTGLERLATLTVTIGEVERSVELHQGNTRPIQNIPFRLELPKVRDSTWYVQHDVGMFALEYDTGQRHPIWVAYILNQALLTGSINRNNFTFDPKIPRTLQPHEIIDGEITIPRYWSTYGYERGHILANADRPFSQAANDQTNFMSNISPHLPEFHNTTGGTGSGGGLWYRLEDLVRQWARNCDTLYVVKGAAIVPGAPGTEIVEVLTTLNRTVVPRYYYMALVQRRGDTFNGIAFWLEQRKGMERRTIRRTDVMTIRELEQKTEIDFFHNLKYVSSNLEEQVETSQPNWTWWPGISQ